MKENRKYVQFYNAKKQLTLKLSPFFCIELAQLSGIAAILRFPMPELEDEDEDENENGTDDSDSDN